jgi:hypothetical protein
MLQSIRTESLHKTKLGRLGFNKPPSLCDTSQPSLSLLSLIEHPSTLRGLYSQTLGLISHYISAMPPRPLRPKDEVTSTDDVDSPAEAKSSKRRAVSSACIPCRKRKSKVSFMCCFQSGRPTNNFNSVTAEDHHALPVSLCTVRNASTTRTATTGVKAR